MKIVHEFEPQTINRTVVMIIPKPKFYAWEKEVFPNAPTTADRDEYSSYLIEDEVFPDEPKKALKNHWEFIFENELFSICTDEDAWPKQRTWKSFTDYFEVKFSTLVFDLLDQPVLKQD
ncbi:MAG: hypothetical protein ACQESK_09920 [Bacteroidota bacterium]